MNLDDQRTPEWIPSSAIPPREDPPWTGWDVALVALVTLVSIVVFSFLALAAAQHYGLLANQPLERVAQTPIIIVPAQGAAYVVVLLFMVLLVKRGYHRPFWQTVRWKWPPATSRFFLGGVVLALAVEFSSALLPVPKALPIERYFKTTSDAYMMAALGVLMAPLLEELFFRGFLYPVMARRLGTSAGVVLTAALFAVVHGSQLAHAWGPLLLLFVVGLVLTIIRARTLSIVPSYLIHVTYNTTMFLILWISTGAFRHLERMGQ